MKKEKARKGNGEGSISVQERYGKKYYIAQATITDQKGEKHRKTFGSYSKIEVVRKLNDAIYKSSNNIYNVDNTSPLGVLFKEWLYNYKKPALSNGSFTKYETAYRLRLKDYPLSNLPLDKVQSIHIQKHINDLQNANESYNNIKEIVQYLKSFFRYCITEKFILYNPCENISLPKKSKKPTRKINVLSSEEQTILEEHLTDDPIDRMILLTLYTGLRIGEVFALKFKDIEESELKIYEQYKIEYEYDSEGNRKIIRGLKDLKTEKSYRTIPLPAKAEKVLSSLKLEHMRASLQFGIPFDPSDFIFYSFLENKHFNSKTPNRRVKKHCENLEINVITFHGLRHTYATRLFEKKSM